MFPAIFAFSSVIFGALFTVAAAYGLGCGLTHGNDISHSGKFATGSAVLSFVIFLLRLGGVAGATEFLVVGGICCVGWGFGTAPSRSRLSKDARVGKDVRSSVGKRVPAVTFAVFTAIYLVYALAPETQSDPNTYHLRPALDAEQTGGFSSEITFYNRLPQGIENLFAVAYAFGGSSSAKLVHFAFLLATVPLLIRVLERLGVARDWAVIAAAMYFCTPVVGIDGTSAFNDAALVFCTLATIELLLAERTLHAGVTAGFCYAIKMTGGLVPGLALVYLIALRRWRAAMSFSIAAGVMIAPWILRNAVEVGNPFAPVLNAWFPNPYFTISGEQGLMAWFRQYDIASAWQIPVELTVYGRALHGMLGPVYLLAPVAVLALRNKTGRVLLALAAVLTVPWQLNWGTRFLMPAIPFLTAGMVLPLPRTIAMGVLALHAATSLPWAIDRYAPEAWHLTGFPVAAALRIESESDYMRRVSWEYNIASMVDAHTRAGDRVLDLYGMQPALAHRIILTDWQSSTGERLRAALQIAQNPMPGMFVEYRSDAPASLYSGVRVRQAAAPSNWSVQEIELRNGSDRVPSGRNWSLSAWPNEWFAPSAFDVNWASSWATWQRAQPGMYVEAEFNEPVTLTSVNVVGLGEERDSRPEVFLQRRDGSWFRADARRSVHTGVNLHRNATKLVTRSGIRYLLVPTGKDGNGPLGVSMSETPADWGVEKIANFQHIYLMRIQ